MRVSGVARPERATPDVVVRDSSPFDNIEQVARGYATDRDMVARATDAIERTEYVGLTDASKERATRLAESNPRIARHILLTGSPAYREAFETVLRYGPEVGMGMLDGEQRDAMRAPLSNTAANGGYSNPWLLDPTVILTNDGIAGSIRSISRVETGTTDKWNGISSAGVTAEWLAEGTEAADKTPTVGQPSVTAYKGAAYVFASYEQEADGQVVAQVAPTDRRREVPSRGGGVRHRLRLRRADRRRDGRRGRDRVARVPDHGRHVHLRVHRRRLQGHRGRAAAALLDVLVAGELHHAEHHPQDGHLRRLVLLDEPRRWHPGRVAGPAGVREQHHDGDRHHRVESVGSRRLQPVPDLRPGRHRDALPAGRRRVEPAPHRAGRMVRLLADRRRVPEHQRLRAAAAEAFNGSRPKQPAEEAARVSSVPGAAAVPTASGGPEDSWLAPRTRSSSDTSTQSRWPSGSTTAC